METLMIGLESMKIFDGWSLQEILDYRRTILIQGAFIVPIAALLSLGIILLFPAGKWWFLLLFPVLAILWWLMQLSCLPEISQCRKTGKSSDQRRKEAKAKPPSIEEIFPVGIPYD